MTRPQSTMTKWTWLVILAALSLVFYMVMPDAERNGNLTILGVLYLVVVALCVKGYRVFADTEHDASAS
ncbi:MAG: hypothetical protein H7Y60_16900 [Rhodospirillaceae bacterium]|nr:hypothetical protein [Rhodospirillales bacterium]